MNYNSRNNLNNQSNSESLMNEIFFNNNNKNHSPKHYIDDYLIGRFNKKSSKFNVKDYDLSNNY
jgi:hypothetical protein